MAGSPSVTVTGQGGSPSWPEWASLCVSDLFARQLCPWMKGPPLHPMQVGRAGVLPWDSFSLLCSLLLSLLLLLIRLFAFCFTHAGVRFTPGQPQSSLLPFRREDGGGGGSIRGVSPPPPHSIQALLEGVGIVVPFDSLGFTFSGFSSSHVWIQELDRKESWVPKNWCFWTVGLEKTLESPLDCKELNQWILKEITPECSLKGLMMKLKLPILWLPDTKSWLIRKDPDAGKDWT